MKTLASVLIIFSFLSASVVSIMDKHSINWGLYIPIIVLGFIGIFIIRYNNKKKSKCEHTMDKNINDIASSLNNICKNISNFSVTKENLFTINKNIDETFIEDINLFLESREVLKNKFNINVFASVMSHFAAGERYLNRAWSASVDGYINEVANSVEKSKDQFYKALNEFNLANCK